MSETHDPITVDYIDLAEHLDRELKRNRTWLHKHGHELTPLGITRYEYAMRNRRHFARLQNLKINPETGEIYGYVRLPAGKEKAS